MALRYRFGDLGPRDRLRVIRAVRHGVAVSPAELAPHAVSYARFYQARPARGSVEWFLSWTEVGPLAGGVWAVVIVFAVNRWGLLGGVVAGVALLPAMILLSRRTSATRQRRAREAEDANAKLLDPGPT
jgi:hypothetical protein